MSLPLRTLIFTALLVSLSAVAQDKSGTPARPKPAPVAPTLERVRTNNAILVAYRLDTLPFAYIDETKQPIGFSIEICKELVASLRRDLKLPNLRIDFVPVTAANRFDTIASGKADMECGLTINNPERRDSTGYLMPYGFSGPRILTRANSGIRDFFDLSGKRVVFSKGANAGPLLRQRLETGILKGTELIEVANNDEAFARLEKGGADAFVTIDVILYPYRANAARPDDWVIVGSYLVLEPMAVLIRHGDGEFKKVMDHYLSNLMLDGVVTRLYNKWFLSPIPPRGVTLNMPMNHALREQVRWPSNALPDTVVK